MSHNNHNNKHADNGAPTEKKDCGCNVGEAERVVSAIAGGYLIYKGLTKGSLLGFALGAAGIYRAATGTCALYKALKVNTNTEGQKLSNVANQAKEIATNVAETAKALGNEAAEQAKTLTNDARNRLSDVIAAK